MRSIAGSLSLIGSFYAYAHLPISDVLTIRTMLDRQGVDEGAKKIERPKAAAPKAAPGGNR